MALTLLTPKLKSCLSLLLLMASPSLSAQTAPKISQLYQFTYPTAVENLISLPNGCLLLSTSADADLWYIDPEALFPAAQNVITLSGSVKLTGIAALGDNFYAVAGAAPNPPGSHMQIYVINVETEGQVSAKVDHVVKVPGTGDISGMAALPSNPRTILSADAVGGRILRVNTSDNTVSVAFEHATLKPNDEKNATAKGVKGLKIRGDHLYFTNSAQKLFGRFPISADGANIGDVEILARLDETHGNDASYDDFSFDREGNAFVAVHPSSIHKVAPGGAQLVFAGGMNSTMLEPTSTILSNSGNAIYVSTAGKDTGYPISGGQVLRVQVGTLYNA
ncbi:hypothetical protein F5B22DRAFT_350813 [Xylaria bambusicola]|uniref:uncharacterized protein n=1 Tax=Xylaria bambusicola TaxID=326684 RepID=UPI002008D698|nr:uncharacterized protein F5B22DRAFT_350813 [Xylaria bambusicola]KAI0525595.1 hypothetical protein F5B22DRAFT_350813 [Xylaria bambusicola]